MSDHEPIDPSSQKIALPIATEALILAFGDHPRKAALHGAARRGKRCRSSERGM